ncbi:alpha/beta hydrolase family protein [Flavonifractor sp. An112]|uniref:alpha/beta hydrolase family protein n=1 Tax=Flavonifractor sp. An112 TaxID=1965544 RepID=UPI00117AF910|nr:alpha/beta fold hydrolase [Flavonifractor sp. An112]
MSKSKTRKTAIILCISIILMLVSAVATMVIQTGGGSITIKELHWETDSGFAMDGWLFIPDGATAENPAPGIVTSHGMYNNKGMQDANFVELARRGYVVLAQDMPSHGESDNVNNVGLVTSGLYQSVKVLADLPYVDKSRIGITGHSMGGMSCNAAIELDNQAEEQLISAVLLNCADATYVDADGAWTNIYGSRDAGIMAAQYDEFFMQDTDENGNTTLPKDYVQYNNAQSFLYFGTDPTGQELRQADTVYYETIDGREAVRVIYNPAITHPWAHFSQRATSAVISFFEETLGAPNPLPADDQIWQVKEAFNLVGLIGFGMFITCFTLLMVKTPFFASLGREEPVAPRAVSGKGKAWFWGSLLLGAIFGSAVYIPIMLNAKTFTVFYDGWPQSSPWGVCLWAAACGLFAILSMVVSYFAFGKKNGLNLKEVGVRISLPQLGKTILLAAIVICVAFGCVFFTDYFFKADFRIWVLAVKTFAVDKVAVAVFPYAIFFLVYYVGNSVALNCFNYNDIGGKHRWINTTIVAVAAVLPAVVLLLMQYLPFFAGGDLMFRDANMQVVWLFPMLVVLSVAAIISRKIYRATNNPYLPGIILGIIVTMISCSNTLTWSPT